MKLNELFMVLSQVAPTSLSDEYCQKYGAYDNSGILLNSGDEVKKALFSLDLSQRVLDEAEKTGANAVVTHHPVIYGKISDVNVTNAQGACLQRAIRQGISVISMHLNFDCAKDGVDEQLMYGVGGKKALAIFEPLKEIGCGYGRVYDLEYACAAEQLTDRLGKEFSTRKTVCYLPQKTVKKVASFCGAGASEEAVEWARAQKADAVVSSDWKHHLVSLATEYGMSVIALTHYSAENYGFEKIYKSIQEKIGVESAYFCDRELL